MKKISWTCTKRKCKSFLKINNLNNIEECNLEHNHEKDSENILDRQALSNNLKRKAQENLERPTKLICQELLVNGDIEQLTAHDVFRVRQNIHASRSSKLPKLPKTLTELHEALDNYDVITNRGENFKFINDCETNIVIFTCSHNLEILRKMKIVFVDGTFKSCPKLFYQLFTIHGVKDNNYFPLVFFLLPNKNSTTYIQAFRFIEHHRRPEIIFADFEKAIHLAVSEVWPQSKLRGCRFHLGQAWWRKIQSLGLSDEFRNKDSEIGQILKYFFGLPLLPPDIIQNVYVELMAIKPVHEKLDTFFDYVLENYIENDSDFLPKIWADFSATSERTTNCCESFHGKLNSRFYSAHPNIFLLIEQLKAVQCETYIKQRSSLKLKSKIIAEKEKLIDENIKKLRDGQISNLQFVKNVCCKFIPH